MRKYILVGLAFVFVTAPGALDAWLSLLERLFGESDGSFAISIGDWYELIFPPLGLAILLVVIWLAHREQMARSAHPTKELNADRESGPVTAQATEEQGTTTFPNKEAPTRETLVSTHQTNLQATPTDLMKLCQGRTSVEARQLVAPYIGLTIRFNGTVSDVDNHHAAGYTVLVETGTSMSNVFCSFGEHWNESVEGLAIGQELTILGRIRKIEQYWINLDDCELVRTIGI